MTLQNRLLPLLSLGLLLAAGCKPPPRNEPQRIYTPRWAFEPWISKDISDTDDTYAFVDGFRSRDIPVGAVVLDSPWETNYNSLVPNPTRYHDFNKLVGDLRSEDIRTVLWITQLVNQWSLDLEATGDTYVEASPNFAEGLSKGFFVDNGALYSWWKGEGAAVDFFNPDAVKWWRAQQNLVLDAGISGWKLDFGDEQIKSDPVQTKAGAISRQQYGEAYYRDFLEYGLSRRGRDFTTMVRAWDESYGTPGRFFARVEDAPVTWMGDNRCDWIGMKDALNEMFISARAGYQVVGSDIGGYLNYDDLDIDISKKIPFSTEVFARWTALGAFSPFMQLHGRANITPWTVPDHVDETVAMYRYWATLHHELVPFFYSLTEEAYAGGAHVLDPVGSASDWPNGYEFAIGNALLVAPLIDGTGKREVNLPSDAQWFDWYHPSAQPLDGGMKLTDYESSDWQRVPLFVRAGAIIPVEVSSDVTGLGNAASKNAHTWLLYPGATASSFTLHEADDTTTRLEMKNDSGVQVTLSRAPQAQILRVPRANPGQVEVDGKAVAAVDTRSQFDAGTTSVWFDSADQFLWVRLPATSKAQTVTIR